MFNIKKVEPDFTSDKYGFTEHLISYINGEDITLPDNELLQRIINNAYRDNDREVQKVLQHALFVIYQCSLSPPLSHPASLQYDSYLIMLKTL